MARARWYGRRAAILLTGALLAGGCTHREQAPHSVVAGRRPVSRLADSAFARVIREFSEPNRFFDTDNLISNEATYLDVASTLDSMAIRGGAYLGVGPDQNFSYIARIHPEIAFLIDLRRDNLLEVLWYKALFHLADTRAEYVALLFGRPVPAPLDAWVDRPVDALLAWVDSTAADGDRMAATRARIEDYLTSLGIGLGPGDFATIARIHQVFASEGPGLRFTTFGRPPRPCYPTYRALLAARDVAGRQASYLATEADFQTVRSLHERNLVIPVVGDLAGPHAIRRIGAYLAARGIDVTAFYVSNVEFYLSQDGLLGAYLSNVSGLPLGFRSVVIRSVFESRFVSLPPESFVRGSCSIQSLQRMAALVELAGTSADIDYAALLSHRPIELR